MNNGLLDLEFQPGAQLPPAGVPLTVDNPAAFAAVHGANLGYDYEFESPTSSLVPPPGWSWVNQLTNTSYTEELGWGTMNIINNAGTSVNMLVRPLPAMSTWTAYAKLAISAPGADTSASGGLILRESATGKFVMFGYEVSTLLTVYPWTSVTSRGASLLSQVITPANPIIMGIQRLSATSWTFWWSVEQVAQQQTMLYQNNISGNFTTAPDQIGFGGYANGSWALGISAHWFRVR